MTNKAMSLVFAWGHAAEGDDARRKWNELVAYIEELERKAQAYDKHANRYADFRAHYCYPSEREPERNE